jgi:hypothetical protein
MAISKNKGRQGVISAFVEFEWDDVPTTATAYAAIDLPPGAIVVGGDLVITTAWNTATTATLAIGDATTGNRYLSATNAKSAARTALVPTGFEVTTTQPSITVTTAFDGTAATAGAARLRVDYIVKKRAAFSQG